MYDSVASLPAVRKVLAERAANGMTTDYFRQNQIPSFEEQLKLFRSLTDR